MLPLVTRSRSIADCALCSVVAAATAVGVLLFGSHGATLLLGPDGAAEAGIALEDRLSR